MKNIILTIVFIIPIFSLSAQRKYSYCRHAYCHELHIYTVPYQNFTPMLVTLALDESQLSPYQKLNCETSNKIAKKFNKIGTDSLNLYVNSLYQSDKSLQNERMKMAIIYFQGAIKHDSTFCDAYDNLVNSYYLTKQYDSAIKVIDMQHNPSFHSSFAKGVMYYEIYKDYPATEQYFKMLSKKEATPIYLYYEAMSQIKLNRLNDAKASVAEMETTLNAWKDGWAMETKSILLKGVIACKEKNYDAAYTLLNRIKTGYSGNSIFCYYYAICLLNKTVPEKGKAKKFNRRANELKYNFDTMI